MNNQVNQEQISQITNQANQKRLFDVTRENGYVKWQHPTGQAPKTVSLVCLGYSKSDYIAGNLEANIGDAVRGADEIWTLNRGFNVFKHDLLFVMDHIQGEADKYPFYGAQLWQHDKPIITSDNCYHWPQHVHQFPFKEIWNWLARHYQPNHGDWFHNSVAYILVYAAFIGVKELRIFGADYSHHSSGVVEDGHPNVAYWVGKLEAAGLTVKTSSDSAFLNANQRQWIYGYLDDPRSISFNRAQFRALTQQRQSSVIDSGERQVANDAQLIQLDHVNRYRWAAECLSDIVAEQTILTNSLIYDCGCGVGYGAHLLANALPDYQILASDISRESIAYAKTYFQAKNIVFNIEDLNACSLINKIGLATVAFEVLEHLQYPMHFLNKIKTKYLLMSVPNEAVVPYSPETAPFHQRHYTVKEIVDLLISNGWSILELKGQTSPLSQVINWQDDCRTIVVCAVRNSTLED